MFDVITGHRSRLCDGSSRRDFLRAGLFGGAPVRSGAPIRELFE
jgi:hypothetical protein